LTKSEKESTEQKKDNGKREKLCEERLDDVCKTWMLKVENVGHAELEK